MSHNQSNKYPDKVGENGEKKPESNRRWKWKVNKEQRKLTKATDEDSREESSGEIKFDMYCYMVMSEECDVIIVEVSVMTSYMHRNQHVLCERMCVCVRRCVRMSVCIYVICDIYVCIESACVWLPPPEALRLDAALTASYGGDEGEGPCQQHHERGEEETHGEQGQCHHAQLNTQAHTL